MSTSAPRLNSDNPSALPAGTRLGEFELLSLLGVGGFGIVYLAFDHALEREVAVKEYMPASLAGRTETLHVSLRSQSDAETFALGLKSFVNEAKMLARFDHPSLLKVHRFWEGNGTAYMAMPVLQGQTVKEVRAQMLLAPDEAWLRALLRPLLGAIEKLHSEGVYHRDIAPDNIQIEPGGHPVLLDFGAARRVIGDKSQTLTAILKPAYAPIEQYAEAGSVKQGPWTDLYALGATLHYLLLHRPPPPATARAVHDDVSLLSVEACPGCSENFLRTVDWMLAPRPIDRPQSVAALREVLDGLALPPLRRTEAAPTVSQWGRTVVVAPPSVRSPETDDQATLVMPRARPTLAPPAPAPVVTVPPLMSAPSTPSPLPAPSPLPGFAAPPVAGAVAAAPASSAWPKWLPLALGGAVAVAAVAAFALWPRQTPTPAVDAAASAPAAAVTAAPASAPVLESAITTVVVPTQPVPTPSADTAAAGARPVQGDKPAARTTGPDRPAGARATAPALSGAAPTAAVQGPVAPAPAPQPEAVRAQAETAPPPVVAAPLEPPKPVAAQGPEAQCGGRNPLSYFVCMEGRCLRSENTKHADCLKWRAAARRD